MVVNAQNGMRWVLKSMAVTGQGQQAHHLCSKPHWSWESKLGEDSRIGEGKVWSNAAVMQYPVNAGVGFDSIIDVLIWRCVEFPKEGGKPQILDIPADHKAQADICTLCLLKELLRVMNPLWNSSLLTIRFRPRNCRRVLKQDCSSADFSRYFGSPQKKYWCWSSVGVRFPGCSESQWRSGFYGRRKRRWNVMLQVLPLYLFTNSVSKPYWRDRNYFKVMAGEIKEGIDLTNNTTQNKEGSPRSSLLPERTAIKFPTCWPVIWELLWSWKPPKRTRHYRWIPVLNSRPLNFLSPSTVLLSGRWAKVTMGKLGEALQRMNFEDPTIQVEYSKELKQIIILGQGEYHLNILKWHLDNQSKTSIHPMEIPDRETITKYAAHYRYKQSGGAGQFG